MGTLAATILNMIFQKMPYDYLLMEVIFTTLGTVLGIMLQDYVKKKTGKNYYSLGVFNLVILGSLVMITSYQAYILSIKRSEDISVLKSPGFC